MLKKKLMEDPYAEDLGRMMGLAGIKPLNSVSEHQMDEQQIEEAPAPKYWELDKKQNEIENRIKQLRAMTRIYGKMVAEEQQYGDDQNELADHEYFLQTLTELFKGFDGEMI